MYLLNGKPLNPNDQGYRALIATAHGKHERPACNCRVPPIPMYIAKHGDLYLVKRMPGTGHKHSPDCESYEPPAELSGLGEVAGAAIQENVEDGTVSLRLDFALSKQSARLPPTMGESEKDTARTDGKKLTLRGMLHYLWDQAGFTRWSPAMEGKRNWRTIQKYLTQAATDKTAKGASLDASLFVPEFWSKEGWDDIRKRRASKLAPLAKTGGARKLMVVIGEVKVIEPARYDSQLVLKHLPDIKFIVNKDLNSRLEKRFAREFSLWNNEPDGHLILIATFGRNETGYHVVEEAALMFVDKHWIPCETRDELELLNALIDGKRSFSKGMRYNLPASRPLAFAVTHDTRPTPVALYVLPSEVPADYTKAFTDLVENSHLLAWHWQPPGVMPALPALQDYATMSLPVLQAGSSIDTEDAAPAPDNSSAEGAVESAPDDDAPEHSHQEMAR